MIHTSQYHIDHSKNKSKTNENKSKTREKIVFDLQLREFIIISKSVSTVLLGHRSSSQKQNMEHFLIVDFV